MILAGDVGGTKTIAALYPDDGDPRSPFEQSTYDSREYSGLEELIRDFLADRIDEVRQACFGLPGPIVGGMCRTPNLAWSTNTDEINDNLPFPISFLNDLEATGYGIATLAPSELKTLHAGEPTEGNAVLIAPGTGLGECILFRDDSGFRPSASEGGHCDFAPRTEEQIEFLGWAMRERFPRISFDRVASGTGISLIYEFFRQGGDFPNSVLESCSALDAPDPAAEISRQALTEHCDLCSKVMCFWVATLGAEAGNLALKGLAVSGIYLGGGIPPKILPLLESKEFLAAIHDKGRLADLVSRIPVKVILNSAAALLGAAKHAYDLSHPSDS